MRKIVLFVLIFTLLAGCTNRAITVDTAPAEPQREEIATSKAECSFTEAFDCVMYSVSPDSIRLVLKNRLTREIKNIEIGVYACDIIKKGGSLAPGEQAVYDITCVTGKVGESYSSAIVINYETDVKHSTLGKLNAVVK